MIPRVSVFCVIYVISIQYVKGKTCKGVTEWNYHQYELLNNMLLNCTKLSGSLVLFRLRPEHDLSFLDHLEEITGYLVISNVTRPTLRLPALRYIRGWEVYDGNALLVTHNYEDQDGINVGRSRQGAGLQFLEFPSLLAIAGGNVSFSQNPALCYDPRDISWDDLFTPTTSTHPQIFEYVPLDPALQSLARTLRQGGEVCASSADGAKCPERCSGGRALYGAGLSYPTGGGRSRCWSPSTCQILSRTVCSTRCHPWARCTGPAPAQCCSPKCLGLCTGPGEHECLDACRNYRYLPDEGSPDSAVTCVDSCLKPLPYDALRRDKTLSTLPYKRPTRIDIPRLRYNHDCVTHCPPNHVIYDFACFVDCPPGYEEEGGVTDTPRCLPCPPGDTSCGGHKSCPGVDLVTPSNLASFEGCTLVKGSLAIARPTFTPSEEGGTVPSWPSYRDLEQSFGRVSILTGSLRIEYLPPYIESLGFFRNLTEIRGRTLALPGGYSLWIKNTRIKYVGLSSLKRIGAGNILLNHNPDLCYARHLDWDLLFRPHNHTTLLHHAKSLAQIEISSFHRVHISPSQKQSLYSSQCGDKVCDGQCSASAGCWGPGPGNCLVCSHYSTPLRLCVPDCRNVTRSYVTPYDLSDPSKGRCLPCHSECLDACTGPGPEQCVKCRNFEYQNACVPLCPPDSYPLRQICQPCHDSCYLGCTGPGNTKGRGGCNHCAYGGIALVSTTLIRCNSRDVVKCPTGFYPKRNAKVLPRNTTTRIYVNYTTCQPCHPYCASCLDGSTRCETCKHYRDISGQFSQRQQVDMVAGELGRTKMPCNFGCSPLTHYQTYKHFGKGLGEVWCSPCSRACKGYGCNGPRDSDCSPICSGFRMVHTNSSNATQKISCRERCPANYTVEISKESGEKFCTSLLFTLPIVEEGSLNKASTGSSTLLISLLGTVSTLVLVVAAIITRARMKKKRRSPPGDRLIATNPFYGTCDSQSILLSSPSGQGGESQPLSPNSDTELKILNGGHESVLTLIKYEELTFGDLLGFGAFGTVHKGLYTRLGAKPQVAAIKTIRNQDLNSQCKEVFQETELLCSVRHPCLLTVIGLCISREYLIVTEYVECGSLISFLHAHDQRYKRLAPSTILTWARQIARGMAYLESQCIVHRDLAARNVLVQSMEQVVISDFGSARVLGLYDNMYKSSGGKMPFKWLAIESINTLVFTHKSDVWSYGVTIWELLTSGAQPYKGIHNTALANMLEAGHRLPQPSSCSPQFYDLLLFCWEKYPEKRPSFKDIQRIFDHYSQSPNQHIFPLSGVEETMECSLNPNPHLKTDFSALLQSNNFSYVNCSEVSTSNQPYTAAGDHFFNNSNGQKPPYYNITNKTQIYSAP